MRYAVTIQFFIHAENDKDAKRKAENIAIEQRYHNDNQCRVIAITEQPFGQEPSRAVFDAEQNNTSKNV